LAARSVERTALITTHSSLDSRLLAAAGNQVPGIALLVVGPEGALARSAVGAADLIAGTPMRTDLAMPWFSMTKIATATTTMRLVERGTLALDVPIAPLVPGMRSLRPGDWAAMITIRHLLQHSGGLANPIPVKWIHPTDRPSPDPDAFLSGLLAKHAKLRFEPGTRSSYSNLGTLILGAAIAHVTERPYEAVVRTEILEPLRMSSTGFKFLAIGSATGYHPKRSPMRLFLPRWVEGPTSGRWMGLRRFVLDGAAYGGLVGTPEDAARFLQMHLRGGELEGTRLITSETAAEMRRIDRRGRRFDLGLGWFRPADQRDADPPFVEHLGGGAGFFDVMRIYPSLGIGAVVMGNSTKYNIDAVAKLALDFAAAPA
jgi:CubicO group peptidase (beta-lactamase class C family)